MKRVDNKNKISYILAVLFVMVSILMVSPVLSKTLYAIINNIPVRVEPANGITDTALADQKVMQSIYQVAQNTPMYKGDTFWLNAKGTDISQIYDKSLYRPKKNDKPIKEIKSYWVLDQIEGKNYTSNPADKARFEREVRPDVRRYGQASLDSLIGIVCLEPGINLSDGSGPRGNAAAKIRGFQGNGLEERARQEMANEIGNQLAGFNGNGSSSFSKGGIDLTSGTGEQDLRAAANAAGLSKQSGKTYYDSSKNDASGAKAAAVKAELTNKTQKITNIGSLVGALKGNGVKNTQEGGLHNYDASGGGASGASLVVNNGATFKTNFADSTFNANDPEEIKVAFALGSLQSKDKNGKSLLAWEKERSHGATVGGMQWTVYNSTLFQQGNHAGHLKNADFYLLRRSDDFAGYWGRMLYFTNSKSQGYEYNKVVQKDGMTIKYMLSSRNEKSALNIKYFPKFETGDKNIPLEEAQKLKFNANTQQWIMGPFKLDYIFEGIGDHQPISPQGDYSLQGHANGKTYYSPAKKLDPKTGFYNAKDAKDVNFYKVLSGISNAQVIGKYSSDTASTTSTVQGTWIPESNQEASSIDNMGTLPKTIPGNVDIFSKYEGTVAKAPIAAIMELDQNQWNTVEVSEEFAKANGIDYNTIGKGQYLTINLPGLNETVFKITGIKEGEIAVGGIELKLPQSEIDRYGSISGEADVKILKDGMTPEVTSDVTNNVNNVVQEGKKLQDKQVEKAQNDLNQKTQQASQKLQGDQLLKGEKPINNWEFVMEKDSRYQNNQMYNFPMPDQKFYIAIKYDPAIESIDGLVFEFLHTNATGKKKLYTQGTYNQAVLNGTNVNVNTNGAFKSPTETQVDGDGIVSEIPTSVPNGNMVSGGATFTLQGSVSSQHAQSQGYVEGGYWMESVTLVIRFNHPSYPYFMPIGGRVWEDTIDTEKKHTGYDNILGANEKGIDGLRVRVVRNFVELDQNQNVAKVLGTSIPRIYWKNGSDFKEWRNYKIFTKDGGRWGANYLRDLGFNKEELKVVNGNYEKYGIMFNVIYEYDGIVYENVIPMNAKNAQDLYDQNVLKFNSLTPAQKAQVKDVSLALENNDARIKYNRAHAEIAGLRPETNMQTSGVAKGVNESGAFTGQTTPLEYKGKLKTNSPKTGEVARFQSEYLAKVPLTARIADNSEEYLRTFMQASTFSLGVEVPKERLLTSSKDQKIDNTMPVKGLDGKEQRSINGTYVNIDKSYLNLNLGLKKRSVDVGLTKDLNNAVAIVNKKATNYMYTTNFGHDSSYLDYALPGENLNTITIDAIQGASDPKKVQKFLDIYKTDYIYRTSMYSSNEFVKAALDQDIKDELAKDGMKDSGNHSKDPRQLDVFLTYKVRVQNDSIRDQILFTQVDDYFDQKLEQVTKTVTKVVANNPSANIETTGINPNGNDVEFLPSKFFKVSKEADGKPIQVDLKQGVDQDWKIGQTPAAGYYKAVTNNTDPQKTIFLKPGEAAEIYTTYRVRNQMNLDEVAKEGTQYLGSLEQARNSKDIILNNALSLGDFTNIAEIGAFAPYDCLTGFLSGKIDHDSAPANFNINKVNGKFYMEDDTDKASGITIQIPENSKDVSRKLQGTVFEDKKTTTSKGVPTGDGILKKEDGEKGINGQVLVLQERISVNGKNPAVQASEMRFEKPTNGQYIDIPFVWPDQISQDDIKVDLPKVTGFTSVVKSGENGKYNFTGVPAGNFVVEMNYSSPSVEETKRAYANAKGKDFYTAIVNANFEAKDRVPTIDQDKRDIKFYNGLDFKNTTFYPGNNLNNIVNTVWLSKDKNNQNTVQSFLRDDETRRVEVISNNAIVNNAKADMTNVYRAKGSLTQYKEAHAATTQVGYTPKMNFAIEYYEKLGENINDVINTRFTGLKDLYAVKGNYAQGNKVHTPTYGYEVTNINLGIVERPVVKTVLNKEITDISLRSADGKEVIKLAYDVTATPTKEKQDKVRPYGSTSPYTVTFDRKVNAQNSIGLESVQPLDRTNMKDGKANQEGAQEGFRYLNFDDKLLQDATIQIRYKIFAYNLSEPDAKPRTTVNNQNLLDPAQRNMYRDHAYYTGNISRSGLLFYNTDSANYGFGTVLGDQYYRVVDGQIKPEDVSKVVFMKVVDFADNSATVKADDKENSQWTSASKQDLVGYIQGVKTKQQAQDAKYIDDRGVEYITEEDGKTLKTNIYISRPENVEIYPIAVAENTKLPWTQEWGIRLDRTAGQQTNRKDLSFRNLAEILEYKTDNGTRGDSTPGNVITQLDMINGNGNGTFPGNGSNSKAEIPSTDRVINAAAKEFDASSTELITLTPPTGSIYAQRATENAIQLVLMAVSWVVITASIVVLIRNYKRGV